MSQDDINYFAQREAAERDAMRAAEDPRVAAIHGQLAKDYAARQRAARQVLARK